MKKELKLDGNEYCVCVFFGWATNIGATITIWATKTKNRATKKGKVKARTSCGYGLLWRRKRDSNPRGIAPKRFSRPPRYDHFAIPPGKNIQFLCTYHRFSKPPRYDHFANPPCFVDSILVYIR